MPRALLLLAILTAFSARAREIPLNDPHIEAVNSGTTLAAASNGSGFLTAWTTFGGFYFPLHTQALDSDATPPTPHLDLSIGVLTHSELAIASNGTDYVVVGGGLGATHALRCYADGNPIDTQQIEIHGATRVPNLPHDQGFTRRSVAWDGARYVITSTIESSTLPTRVIASTMTADGRVRDVEIPVQDEAIYAPVAARNGIAVIAVKSGAWIEVRTMNVANVVSSPVPLDITTLDGTSLASAAGDDGFLIVWNNGSAIRAQHLSPTATPDGPLLTLGAVPRTAVPAVTWHGSAYLVVWAGGTVLVTGNGQVRSLPTAVMNANAKPTVASNGRVAVVTDAGSIRAVHAEEVSDPFPITFAPPSQFAPHAAASGSLVGAAWVESTANGSAVLFQRITRDGRRLDGQGILIGYGDNVLQVGANDDGFLVVWNSRVASPPTGYVMTRVTADGAIIDPVPIELDSTANGHSVLQVEVLPAGSDFIVALPQFFRGIGIARVAGRGFQPAPALSTFTPDTYSFSVATNGTTMLLVYVAIGGGTHGVLIDQATFAARGIALPMSPQADYGNAPNVAANGSSFLVVWFASADRTLRALPVTSSGEAGRATTIATNVASGTAISIMATQTGYRTLWQDASGLHDAILSAAGTPIQMPRVLPMIPSVRFARGIPAAVYTRGELTVTRALINFLEPSRQRTVSH